MQMRTRKPEAGNKFYITRARGGYSLCIQGYPKDANCDVLSNCVGYACGRFNEIIGSMKYPSLNCNAENFIERAISAGLSIANKPSLGGIMVWKNGTLSGNDGAGHVAIVERIDSENQIYTSESSYGSTAFWNQIRTNSNNRWGLSKNYTFRGCIINPAIGYKPFEPKPAPTPTVNTKYKVGDKVICINPFTLELDTDTVVECDGEMNKKHTCYDNWYFSDGTIITTINTAYNKKFLIFIIVSPYFYYNIALFVFLSLINKNFFT